LQRLVIGVVLLASAAIGMVASPQACTGLFPLILCAPAAALIASAVLPRRLFLSAGLAVGLSAFNFYGFTWLFHQVQQHRFSYTVLPDFIGFQALMMLTGLTLAPLLAVTLGIRWRKRPA
jgi:hypothetical protein